MIKSVFKAIVFLIILNNQVLASLSGWYPKNIVRLDNEFAHHVIVAEKATHRLFLFKNEGTYPKLVKTYTMASGKKSGNKSVQGDYRTPEGVYIFNEFLSHKQLMKRNGKDGIIYGVGAFVTNYPNPMDRRDAKTGNGIWLHSTNDETRIENGLDSRGCVVISNNELVKLAEFIELNKTPFVVVENLNYLDEKSWTKERNKIEETVLGWLTSWESEDHKNYIKHYHRSKFYDARKGKFKAFSRYKIAVFNNPGKPQITMSNLSIMTSNNYAKVTFKQKYISNTIRDTGLKKLYLVKDKNYDWKIVSETWHRLENKELMKLAYKPEQRFFIKDEVDYFFRNQLKSSNN